MPTTLVGQQTIHSSASPENATAFLVQQLLSRIATTTLVQVVAVRSAGGVAPVGSVDVQPMVGMVDGAGQVMPHRTIHDVPYFRLQGGANAVILDPQVGDIGMAGFASRDISKVKRTRGVAGPDSYRRFDMADALYFGGLLNGTPTQYVQFTGSGIMVKAAANITLDAPGVMATQNLTCGNGYTGPLVDGNGNVFTVRGGVITAGS